MESQTIQTCRALLDRYTGPINAAIVRRILRGNGIGPTPDLVAALLTPDQSQAPPKRRKTPTKKKVQNG